jgi:hypothetical protein
VAIPSPPDRVDPPDPLVDVDPGFTNGSTNDVSRALALGI